MIHTGSHVGEWVIEEPLGRGGMGTVFRCRNLHADRLVAAIKVIPLDVKPDMAAWFRREVAALAALRHPSIVRIHTAGSVPEEGMVYVVMELVEGETLRDHLRQHGALSAEDAPGVLVPVADALAHAHEKGVHHCDIKPANIVLPPRGRPMLVDFGIAQLSDEEVTQTTAEAMGTPEYMAPELIDGANVDLARCDIYALGVVFWEALTGQRSLPPGPSTLTPPQRVARVVALKQAAVALDPGPDWPDGWRALVREMTSPRPDERPANMHEVVNRMLAVASPPSTTTSAAARPPDDELRRWLFGGVVAAVVLGAAAAGLTMWWTGLLTAP